MAAMTLKGGVERMLQVSVDKDLVVENLCFDSRAVTTNTLFVCKGIGFKEAYIKSAKEKGAIAFVSEQKYNSDNLILVKDIRRAMALLSNMFFSDPWNEFPLVGLTGTKGKSTTLAYIVSIMEGAAVCGKDKINSLKKAQSFAALSLTERTAALLYAMI